MIRLIDILKESINDRFIFKSVFLAGGPGSGKSFVGKEMFGNEFFGAKVISSDIFFEFFLRKENLPFVIDPTKDEYELQMQQREKAKRLAKNEMFNAVDGCLPILVDGTGDNYDKVVKTATNLRELGYDTAMVFVNTSLSVAKQRNQKRERTVPEDMLVDSWKHTQENMGKFQMFFGNANFNIIDNSVYYAKESEEYKQLNMKFYKTGQKMLSSPLQNPIGKELVKQMKTQGAKYLHQLKVDKDIMSLVSALKP